MAIVQILADNIVSTRFSDLSADDLHWTRVSVLDTIGVTLAGAADPALRILTDVTLTADTVGTARIIGSNRHCAPLDAALINGTAAHVLDFDLSNDTFSGHATVHLFPALLALGQQRDLDGAQFATAYVAGFEAQARIAKGINPVHVKKGWFPTSTIGVFGSAAGAARLLDFDPEQTAQAISLAAMFAGGVMAHGGSMTKPLGAGNAARQGLFAALLVEKGFTAATDAIDDRRGFLTLFNGAGAFNVEAMSAGWGDPFVIGETATGIKRYPCCGAFHSSLDVLTDLVRANGLGRDDIVHVGADLVTSRFGHIDRPEPRSGSDAKFSVQYCLALIAAKGSITQGDFEGDAHRNPDIRVIMSRISARLDPATPPDVTRAQEGGARVTVTTTDGRNLVGQASKPHGRVPGQPLPQSDIEEKFLGCAAPVLGQSGASQLLGMLSRLETLPSLRGLGLAMAPG